MLMLCRIEKAYFLLSSMPGDYFKNPVSMLGSVLKPIVSIMHVLIKLNCMPTVTMDSKMQLEQGSRRMRRDWVVESSSLQLSLPLLDIRNSYIRMQWLFVVIMVEQISSSHLK